MEGDIVTSQSQPVSNGLTNGLTAPVAGVVPSSPSKDVKPTLAAPSSHPPPLSPTKAANASSNSSSHAVQDSHGSSSHKSSSSSDPRKDGLSRSSDQFKSSNSVAASSNSSSKDKLSLNSSSTNASTPVSIKISSVPGSSSSSKDKPREGSSSTKDHKSSSSSSNDKLKTPTPSSSSSSKIPSSSSSIKDSTSSSTSKPVSKPSDGSAKKDSHHSSGDKQKDSSSKVHSSSGSGDKTKPKDSHSSSSTATTVKIEPASGTPAKSGDKPGSSASASSIKKPADDSDDDVPLIKRMEQRMEQQKKAPSVTFKDPSKNGQASATKPATPSGSSVKSKKDEAAIKRSLSDESDDESQHKSKKTKPSKAKDDKGKKRKLDQSPDKKSVAKKVKTEESPTKKGKGAVKTEEEETKWRWWEEIKTDNGVKWTTLEHKGPVFAPPYEPLPADVVFRYDGKVMKLSEETEEVATFYAKMLDHEYTTRDIFNKNFFKDWRGVMTSQERAIITDLKKCDFKEMAAYFKQKSEERKSMTKEQKQEIKKANDAIVKEFGFCIIDGHKQKIGNFKIEPPGLFRGRGNHPKQGMLKRRVMPKDVSINCSKGVVVAPPAGHKWKDVRHDNTVTWLASWTENVQNQTKYVMLNAASKLKGQKDWQKYETARRLHTQVDKIRETYRDDWKSKEMRIRQRAVALYFIDKLALRAGNEKDEDQADTVGCCSLRVEHIKLHEEYEGQEFVVEFDFPGKDSIRYYNRVAVEKRVFKNLQLFMENKNGGDDLFDRLSTMILNKHLQSLMDGLTAKVFRTYNASVTLERQLDMLTVPDDTVAAKLLSYNRANRAVAVLCNHQRAAPKNFEVQMSKIQEKIEAKMAAVKEAKKEAKNAKAEYKAHKSEKNKKVYEQKKKAHERMQQQLTNLKVQQTDRDENKEIALGTSKLNYLDPRISVAWCLKWGVPLEKVYNKTQRDKFAWAIDMTDAKYRFTDLKSSKMPMPSADDDEEEEEEAEDDDE